MTIESPNISDELGHQNVLLRTGENIQNGVCTIISKKGVQATFPYKYAETFNRETKTVILAKSGGTAIYPTYLEPTKQEMREVNDAKILRVGDLYGYLQDRLTIGVGAITIIRKGEDQKDFMGLN